jgi:CheY-specific phosphatase CheX
MISPDEWLAATTKSLVEVVETYFDVSTMSEALFDEGPKCGTMIGLVSDDNAVQMMLVATKQGAEILAKALLGFEPDEEIDPGDLADAIGEIINIVAGMVKTVLNDQDKGLNLTLPTFVDGTLTPITGQTVSYEVIEMGPVQAKVLIVNGNRVAKRKPRASAA